MKVIILTTFLNPSEANKLINRIKGIACTIQLKKIQKTSQCTIAHFKRTRLYTPTQCKESGATTQSCLSVY